MKRQVRNDILIKSIGSRLREIREEKGVSQEVVVFKTGIYVMRIEAGELNITISTLTNLCEFYGVTLDKFFDSLNYE